jgi:hypothetical protein
MFTSYFYFEENEQALKIVYEKSKNYFTEEVNKDGKLKKYVSDEVQNICVNEIIKQMYLQLTCLKKITKIKRIHQEYLSKLEKRIQLKKQNKIFPQIVSYKIYNETYTFKIENEFYIIGVDETDIETTTNNFSIIKVEPKKFKRIL